MRVFLYLLSVIMLTTPKSNAEVDPHSYSNPHEVVVQNLDLKLNVDFAQEVLRGQATLKINRLDSKAALHLDTYDLKLARVIDTETREPMPYRYARAHAAFGQELIIELGPETDSVTIEYETSPKAGALQWLKPEQTLGKKQPFLFTQSQSIHARSWIPLQDTPEVRMTYSADVVVPTDLLALMSAENPQSKSSDGHYHFEMPQPIPSYLIALAVGDLAFESLGPRTGVYAEPAMLKAAAWELANMEKLLTAGERATGVPWLWDRYDTLILPPSFPFGGMENPRLCFASPTVIVGDRSMESLSAHEASHGWTGNCVTNKNMNHFFLNEGFTVFLERRIIENVYGRDLAELQAAVGFTDLKEQIELDYGKGKPEWTTLRADLTGVDPDEVYSVVPYEKGYLFLRHIEDVVGRARMNQFLTDYIQHFKFQSIGTEDFVRFLESDLIQGDTKVRAAIDARTWIDQPGLPEKLPTIHSKLLDDVQAFSKRYVETGDLDLPAAKAFSTYQWVYFLNQLPQNLSPKSVQALDKVFGLTDSPNVEIASEWLRYAIKQNYPPAFPRVRQLLQEVGRGKFLKPLYRALDNQEHRAFAAEIFKQAAPGYHGIMSATLQGTHKFEGCDRYLR
jgi:leukotriene A-4 hydrolase/aminopeptidase